MVDDAAIREKARAELPAGLQKRRLTMASLGRLTHQKGYDVLLRVHDRLIRDGMECDLWIAGEGEDRPALEQFIAEHRLQDSVKLLGFCENPYPILQAADVLACSSRYEGLSTFVTEGLILAKPIVTTNCTGMRELLGESEYGLIAENDDEAFYQALKQMLSDSSLRELYAKKAAARGKDFSTAALVETAEIYFTECMK